MFNEPYLEELAATISQYSAELLRRGMDPYVTLQLTLGLQASLVDKVSRTYAIPGALHEENKHGNQKDHSRDV
jgi:hypothetical protein